MALPFPKKKNNFNTLINNDQEGFWWKKAWRQGKKALAKTNKPLQSRGLLFEALEPRVLMSADITIDTAGLLNMQGDASDNTFVIEQTAVNETGATLSLTLDGGPAQIFSGVKGLLVNTADGNDSIELLNTITVDATLGGGKGDDNLIAHADADFSLSGSILDIADNTFSLAGFENLSLQGGASDNAFVVDNWSGSLAVDGGAGNDTLFGPANAEVTWNVTGANAGEVANVQFSAIENLSGASDNQDTFHIEAGGSIDGIIDGGSGGFDSLVINTSSPGSVHFSASGPHSGSIAIDEQTISYDGLEPITLEGAQTDIVVDGSSGNDRIVVEILDGGMMRVSSSDAIPTFESVTFQAPSKSLTVNGKIGSDTITVQSVDPAFAANLQIYGNEGGVIGVLVDYLGDPDNDTVSFTGDVSTHGGLIEAVADIISVDATLSTRAIDGNGIATRDAGSIGLNAREITLNNGAALLAQVQTGSAYKAGDITLKAKAASIVRTANTPKPETTITVTNAEIKGDAIFITADAAERFGVFGFKKDAVARVTISDSVIEGSIVGIDAQADTTLDLQIEDATMTGNPKLTFTHRAGGFDTITRDSGSWLPEFGDGFVTGQSITISGTAHNDGSYLIGVVSEDTIVLAPNEIVADEVTDPTTAPVTLIGTAVMPDPESLVDLLTPFTGSAIVTLSNAVAEAKVLGASRITAVGDVLINSNAASRATPFFPGFAIPYTSLFSISAAWADSTAIAESSIQGTTQVTARNLGLSTTTDNTTMANALAFSQNKPVSLTFAGAKITGSTKTFLGEGTTVNAGDVALDSEASTDNMAAATVFNAGASGLGLAVAISLIDTDTQAWVAGTVHATGDVSVSAATKTINNITMSDSSNLGGTSSLMTQVNKQVNQFGRDAVAPLTALGTNRTGINPIERYVNFDLFPIIETGKLNFSGAITYAQAENDVHAFISSSAHVTAGGAIGIHASMTDYSNSGAVSEATSGGVSVGGAIVVSNFDNDVKAYIDRQATVNANGAIDVHATSLNPYPWEIDFTSAQGIIEYFGKGLFNLALNSYVINFSVGSDFGLSGAVDVRRVKNIAEAYIDAGAVVNGDSVTVYARNESNGLHAVGEISGRSYPDQKLTNFVADNTKRLGDATGLDKVNAFLQKSGIKGKLEIKRQEDAKAGIGGSISYFDIDNKAIARIADGAKVKAAGDVNVLADAIDRLIVITVAGGTSDKLGVFGSGDILFQGSTALAYIEDKAQVTAGDDLTVLATNDPRVYNISGGVVQQASVGIGASVAMNHVDVVTKAFIGNGTTMGDSPQLTFTDVRLTGNPSIRFEDVALTGAPVLTFRDNAGSSTDKRDTITRNSGSWLDDGFKPGQRITIEGSAGNDGTYRVAEVTALTLILAEGEALATNTTESLTRRVMSGAPALTFADNEALTDKRDTITRGSGSWLDDGFAVGQVIRIEGAGDNDGLYMIDAVAANTLTLISSARLKTGPSSTARIATVAITAPDKITRSSGSWIDDGFLPGQTITVGGAGANNGSYRVESLTDTEITLVAYDRLADQTVASGATVSSGDTITRDSGSWIADGFKAGQIITVGNAGANNGSYEIAAVTKTLLTLVPAAALTDATTSAATITDDPAAATGVIKAGDNIDVQALSGPQIFSFSLAGSIAGPKDQAPAPAGAGASAPAAPPAAASAAGGVGSTGGGIAGSASVNIVDMATLAYVNDVVSVESRDLTLVAMTAGAPRLTGKPTLVFAPNGAYVADTITRSSGNWIAEGFRAGQSIAISGTALNNGTWRIASLTATTLTLTPDAGLIGEVTGSGDVIAGPAMTGAPTLTFDAVLQGQDTIERSSGSWIADGFRPGMKIMVKGSARNDGEYEIVDVTPTTLTLVGNLIGTLFDDTLEDEENAGNVVVTAAEDGKAFEIIGNAGAVTKSTQPGSGVGIAGSFSMNVIDAETNAYVRETTVRVAEDLVISAKTPATILSVGASLLASSGSGKANLAGQASYNNITNETRAFIDDATISGPIAGGSPAVVLRADDDSYILAVSGAVAFGGRAGIGASVSINTIGNVTEAFIRNSDVSAASVEARAKSGTQITSVTAAIGASSGQMAAEAAVSVNLVTNHTAAFISGRKNQGITSAGNVTLDAEDNSGIFAFAGGLAAAPAGTAAIGISVTYNQINNDTLAYIDDSTVKSTGGSIRVAANSDPNIVSVAVGGAVASRAGFAGSVSFNVIGSLSDANTTSASITGTNTFVLAYGNVIVSAYGDADINTFAGAVAGAGTGAIALANSTIKTDEDVLATIGAGATIVAKGKMDAAFILNGQRDSSGTKLIDTVTGVAVVATSFEDFLTIAVGGAGAGTAGVAGSATVTVLDETTHATIAENAKINTGTLATDEDTNQSVRVLASDRTRLTGVAGAVALGGTAGVGVGVDVEVITKETEARIGSAASVEAQRDVRVEANSSEDVISAGVAGSGAGTAGLAGAVDVSVFSITTRATVEGGKTVGVKTYAGADIDAGGTVKVAAEERLEFDGIAGSLALGGTAGIGGAAAVPIVTKTTEAFIGTGATVDGRGNADGIDVRTGDFDVGFDTEYSSTSGQIKPIAVNNGNATDSSLTRERHSVADTRGNFKGVAVTAINQDDIGSYAVGVGGSGTVAIQISATVHVMDADTKAYIGDGAKVNQASSGEGAEQSVLVAAGNDFTRLGVAGGLSITGVVAVTPGVDVGVINTDAWAWIGAGAQVDAQRDIDVLARSKADVLSISVSAAGSGTVSVAGAVSALVFNTGTKAWAGDSAVLNAGGNVVISAQSETDVDVIAGALGVGIIGGGVGAGVGVIVIDKDTQAWVGQNADIDAKGNFGTTVVYDGTLSDSGVFGTTSARGLSVTAVSSEDVFAVAAAGAGGFIGGVAGAVTVEVIDSDTRAFIDAGAKINTEAVGANAAQDVHVAAINDLKMLVVDGSIAGGVFGGIAGSVDVGIVRNDSTAYIAGGDVRARRDVTVSALSDREINSYVVSAAGGAVGIGAAVAVYALGGNFTGTYSFDADNNGSNESENAINGDGNKTATQFVDEQANPSSIGSLLTGYAGSGSSNSADVASAANSAKTRFDASEKPGANTIAGESVNALQTVGSASVPRGTTAFIGANANINAGRHIDLDASERINLRIIAGGLGAGGLGIGAGISVLTTGADVTAFIGQGATLRASTVDSTGDITVDAWLKADYALLGVTAGMGGFAGIAGSVAVVTDTSNVRAYVQNGTSAAAGDRARLLEVDQISLSATKNLTVKASTLGAGAGVAYGVGAAVTVINASGETRADIGNWTLIGDRATTATDDVGGVSVTADSTIFATHFDGVKSMAIGLGVGYFAGGAAGVATVNLGGTIESRIGSDADVEASGAVVLDADSVLNADVDADGGAIGAIAIGAMIARADVVSTTQASVRRNARINAGSLLALAQNTTDSKVGTISAAGGIGAGVGTKAETNVKPTVLAFIDNGASVTTSGDVKIEAVSVRAKGAARGFGVVIGGVAVRVVLAEASVTPTAHANIGDDATVSAGGRVDVLANILAKTTSAPLDDFFQPNGGDVDTNADRIRFDQHSLNTGNTVTYDPDPDGAGVGLPANTAVQTAGGPLQSGGREYKVIVVDGNHIKLGVTFGAGTADTGSFFTPGVGVDGARDVIRFSTQHKLLTGDSVKYDPGTNASIGGGSLTTAGTYFVQKIDEFTIKLYATLAEANAAAQQVNLAGGDATHITVTGAGFSDGTRVTYREPAPIGFTRDLVEQKVNPSIDANTPANQYYLAGPDNSLGIKGHGFTNGEKVTYRTNGMAINGLVNDGIYYVIVVDADTIQLALTKDGTDPDDDGNGPHIGITPVAINRDAITDGLTIKHLLERAPIGGLVNGQSYYVVGSNGATFSLSDTQGGSAITLNKSDRSGVHTIGLAGIDLTPSAGTHELRIDLTSPAGGNHRLLGPGGVSLRTINPPSGDGLSLARVEGGGGGGLNVSNPTAKLTITNDAHAWVAGTLVSAGKDIVIATQSVSRGDGYNTNGGGGVIQAADITARADVTNTSKAYLTGDGVKLKSAGQVALKSDSNIYTHVYATADGGGIGAGSNARALTRVDNDSANGHGTLTQIGQGAHIEADTVNLNSQVSKLSTYAHSRALAGGLVAVAISNSDIDTDSTVNVQIDPGVRVKSTRGVDIGAFHRNTSADYDRQPIPIAFIPIPIWEGSQSTNLTDLVQARDGVRIQTAPRANSNTPLTVKPGYNQLALLVQADNVNANDVDGGSRKIQWDADVEISAGPSPEVLIDANGNVVKAIGTTVTTGPNGEAIVADIGSAGGGEVLFISDKILNDSLDSGNDFRALFQFANTFSGVTITNLSTRSLVINNISLGGGSNPFVDLQGNEVGLTFDLLRTVSPSLVVVENLNTQDGFAPDIVLKGRIENPIGQTRITALTGDIVAGTARDQFVTGLGGLSRTALIRTRNLTLDAQKGTIGFDAQVPGSKNHLAVDIIQGPLVVFDSTHHLETADQVTYHASPATSPLGNLADGGTYFVIRLDDLRIRLASSLANARNGVAIAIDPANLEKGAHTITKGATTLAITDGIRLVAKAGADNYVDLKGRLRDPAAQLGDAGDENVNPHVFNIDLIQAGMIGNGTADVVLQSAVLESATGNVGGVRVRASSGPAVDKTFYNQFRPEDPAGATFGAAIDVGFYGGDPSYGGNSKDIKATYNFVNPQDGTAGLIANGDPDTGNIIVKAEKSAPDDIEVNVTGITEILGSGHIDVLTNGFITLTEQTGDMRVGNITSTANDVTLTAPQWIVDALDDAVADVTGVNITLTAVTGGIGNAGAGTRINFLETNLLDDVGGVAQSGVLKADAPLSIYIEETAGDLRVHHVVSDQGNVSLVARNGSIIDAHNDLDADGIAGTFTDADGRVRDAVNVRGVNIDLDANGGSIGLAGDDLDIDSGVSNGAHTVGVGRLFAEADGSVFITEVNDELNVLAAMALGGDLRLTVPDTSAVDTQNLNLLAGAGATARVEESTFRVVTTGDITASLTVALWVGDNVITTATSRILAGIGITIRGDTRRVGKTNDVDTTEVDDGHGTQMLLPGTIGKLDAPADLTAFNNDAKDFTQIFGHGDVDTFMFDQTKLDANTTAYGSQFSRTVAPFVGAAIFADNGATDDTITRASGSWITDGFQVGQKIKVEGSASNDSGVANYVIAALTDTLLTLADGSSLSAETATKVTVAHVDGEDRFVVDQLRSMHVDRNGIGDTLTLDGQAGTDSYLVQTTGSQGAARNYVINVLDTGAPDDGVDVLSVFGIDGSEADGATDDIFLLRRITAIPSEAATAPAFVALLHGNLDQARTASADGSVRPQEVQRINYDANLNGRLQVYGAGGNDYFAVDDNSAITSLDGGSGKDAFQIGQI